VLFFERDFFLLFGLFFICYWRLTPGNRPTLIVLTSYAFYGAWDWRFLSLLAISTFVDFVAAQKIEDAPERKTAGYWLSLSILVNLGMLGTFKYFDFFAVSLATLFGFSADGLLLRVVLPAGISFYTFQTLSYTIDVYRGAIRSTRDPLLFAAFVSFFPQLVAGPIERAGVLIHQLSQPAKFRLVAVREGIELFVLGLVKKLVIADNLARFVDPVFENPAAQGPLTLLFAAYAFAFQVYCDFSGYTDMARGLARSIGIDLSVNFRRPYLATSVRDFWQRWHITLYSWFRDYVYFPLGGSRYGRAVRNIIIVFLLSGLWHGAGWNFVLWGLLHGVMIGVERTVAPTALGRMSAKVPGVIRSMIVFQLIAASWIIFRSPDLATVGEYFVGLTAVDLGSMVFGLREYFMDYGTYTMLALGGDTHAPILIAVFLVLAMPLVAAEIWLGEGRSAAELLSVQRSGVSFITYLGIACALIWFRADEVQKFIYFQF